MFNSFLCIGICLVEILCMNCLKASYYEDFEKLEWQYFSTIDEETEYLNSWAVQIKDSLYVASSIAERYGFVNMGKIGNLEDYYQFYLPHGRKIYLEHVTSILKNDTQIGNVHQQKRNVRMKKSFQMPSDPLWSEQWSLYNNGKVTSASGTLDLNVVRAWMQGITGENVVVSVVDDGLDHYHTDLSKKYDKSASFNYAEYKYDPIPADLNSETHGTVIAGVVGMQRNTICGVGVAYNARIGGIRVDLESMSDIIESCALGHHNSYIEIYSNSWGPSDNGYTLEGPGQLLQKTFEEAARTGRKELGSIYVWAAGNGGLNGDMCSCDGYASSIYTIAVGSVDEHGKQAPYDENCPAKIAVTFSFNSASYNEKSSKQFQLPSTSTKNRCTSNFTGTSASTALATGVIGLALQVNSSLTWRDIQYLLVYTSNPYKLKAGNWTQTGAGLRVSREYGFGAIDAEAVVMRAKYWTGVPERISCFVKPEVISAHVYKSSPLSTFINVFSYDCPVIYIEHVVVRATMSIKIDDHYEFIDYYDEDYVYENPFIVFFRGPRRGAISMKLVSPHGTPSHLLENRPYDFVNSKGFYQWPFTSVHHWGENPTGSWGLSVTFNAEGGHVLVSNISMTIYGTVEIPEAIKSSSCNESCSRGCSHNTSSIYCDSCRELRMADSLLCVSSCPSKYCNIAGYCLTCPPTSKSFGTTFSAVLGSVSATIAISAAAMLAIVLFCMYRRWKAKNLLKEGFTRF